MGADSSEFFDIGSVCGKGGSDALDNPGLIVADDFQ